jgi:predicted porin
MKNLLALTALATACGAVSAQVSGSSVTLYGLVDVGVNRVSGLEGGSDTRLASGIMEGSRLGVRGNEDMGGGYRAIFTLESRLEADTGDIFNRPPSGSQLPDRFSSAALLGLPAALQPAVDGVAAQIGSQVGVNIRKGFWDRQAYVGLVTPVGAVLAGRQYTPAYEVAANFDIMGTQSSLAPGQIASLPASFEIRTDNALAYRIQTGPFSGGLMYGFGEVEGSNSANRLLGLSAMYRSDMFSAGLGYNTRKNELGDSALKTLVLGASATFSVHTVSALFSAIKDDNPSGLSAIADTLTPIIGPGLAALVQGAFVDALKQDARLMHIGYKFSSQPHTVYVAYNLFNDRTAANADVASYGVAYSYALSKRTDLNAVLTRYNNKNLAQAAPGGNGFIGGVTASPGTDSNNFALGIRHRF